MASEQFIIEMHQKLHPRSKKKCCGDLTGRDVSEIMAIVEKKHAIGIGSSVLGSGVCVDVRVLRQIMTSATLHVNEGISKHDEEKVTSLLNADGDGWDSESMADWLENYSYWTNQQKAIELIEKQVLEALVAKTNEENFYLS